MGCFGIGAGGHSRGGGEMTDAYDLYKRYSVQELVGMDRKLANDSGNKNPAGSFNIYRPHVVAKMREIAWAITMHRDCENGKNVVE